MEIDQYRKEELEQRIKDIEKKMPLIKDKLKPIGHGGFQYGYYTSVMELLEYKEIGEYQTVSVAYFREIHDSEDHSISHDYSEMLYYAKKSEKILHSECIYSKDDYYKKLGMILSGYG